MNYVDYEDILRRKRDLSDLLTSGAFDPKDASTEDIRWAQRLIGTKDDGIWGTQSRKAMDSYRPYGDDYLKRSLGNGDFDPKTASPNDIKAAQSIIGTKADGVWGEKSQAALDTYRKSYDGPVKFRWNGMEGNEAAQAYSAWDTSRIEAEERIAANEKRIEELKKEYLVLQQKQETATEDLERNVAANRAGLGDTSQYNAWRARVEAREAQNQAREADSAATLRQAKSRLNNALLVSSYARGDKEKAAAQQVYEDELAAYNELARKLGAPEISASKLPGEKTYTRGDVEELILKHRNKNREWDSQENLDMTIEAAKTLPDADKTVILNDIYGNITEEDGNAKRKAFMDKVKKEVELLKAEKPGLGDHTITVDGKEYTVTIKGVDAGNNYAAYFNGNRIGDPWEAK